MFEVRAKCDNSRCSAGVFIVDRPQVTKKSTSGTDYTIKQVVCPECRMWATVTGIKEKKAQPRRSAQSTPSAKGKSARLNLAGRERPGGGRG